MMRRRCLQSPARSRPIAASRSWSRGRRCAFPRQRRRHGTPICDGDRDRRSTGAAVASAIRASSCGSHSPLPIANFAQRNKIIIIIIIVVVVVVVLVVVVVKDIFSAGSLNAANALQSQQHVKQKCLQFASEHVQPNV